jgi:UDP-N-acetylmuramoylalanine--D-glutamate ligase
MQLKDKNILILGLGVSGVSSAKALKKLGANITISDSKTEGELKDKLNELKGLNINYKLGNNDVDLTDVDLIVKSPGIPLDVPIIKKANDLGIEVITDIELAYRISENTFIAITGTNGKTTTTTLTGEIVRNSGIKCHVTGNIGVGILWEVVNSKKDDIFVVEASSFQLENTRYFKPKISVIINITPDHIKWHKTFENYINAKAKIFKNQDKECFTILNYDDPILRKLSKEVKGNLIYFSLNTKLERGIYLDGYYIVANDGIKARRVMSYKDVKVPGKHILEDVLASIAVGWVMGIPLENIAKTVKQFEGVEHRVEFVDCINGVSFYNDSKGTNPDASIKAIEAINSPIILIAGGLDKGNDFDEFIKSFNNKVKALVLLGETASKIKETAIRYNFHNIYIVENMEGAVNKAFSIGEKGDTILLSPACASWDMYKSFEERGRDFKRQVANLRGQ